MTQAEYKKLFEPSEMDAARCYAYVVKLFFLTVIYIPLMPYCTLVCALSLVSYEWIFKYRLLRVSKRGYKLDKDLAQVSILAVFSSIWILSAASWWFQGPTLKGAGHEFLCGVAAISAVCAISSNTLTRLIQKIKNSMASHRDTKEGALEHDIDFYEAQKHWQKHEFYHTTQLVYNHCARKRAIQKKEALDFDLNTGRFLSSKRTPPAADVTEASGANPALSQMRRGEGGGSQPVVTDQPVVTVNPVVTWPGHGHTPVVEPSASDRLETRQFVELHNRSRGQQEVFLHPIGGAARLDGPVTNGTRVQVLRAEDPDYIVRYNGGEYKVKQHHTRPAAGGQW